MLVEGASGRPGPDLESCWDSGRHTEQGVSF